LETATARAIATYKHKAFETLFGKRASRREALLAVVFVKLVGWRE
jgi:hypothetical protein